MAKQNAGVHLFEIWCTIVGGGPPLTMVHMFDFPFEEDDQDAVKELNFGHVRKFKLQSYVENPEVYTGTRLFWIVLHGNLPLNGYLCRPWYRGQPLICNLCAAQIGRLS